jgi:hypothetical protein
MLHLFVLTDGLEMRLAAFCLAIRLKLFNVKKANPVTDRGGL